MALGSVLAFLVLVAAVVLALVHQLDAVMALMFAGLALAILLGAIPLPWRAA